MPSVDEDADIHTLARTHYNIHNVFLPGDTPSSLLRILTRDTDQCNIPAQYCTVEYHKVKS